MAANIGKMGQFAPCHIADQFTIKKFWELLDQQESPNHDVNGFHCSPHNVYSSFA